MLGSPFAYQLSSPLCTKLPIAKASLRACSGHFLLRLFTYFSYQAHGQCIQLEYCEWSIWLSITILMIISPCHTHIHIVISETFMTKFTYRSRILPHNPLYNYLCSPRLVPVLPQTIIISCIN